MATLDIFPSDNPPTAMIDAEVRMADVVPVTASTTASLERMVLRICMYRVVKRMA